MNGAENDMTQRKQEKPDTSGDPKMGPGSVFLAIDRKDWVFEGEHFFVIRDKYPVSEGHLLIISKIPRTDFFSLTEAERDELPLMMDRAAAWVEAQETVSPDGFNIGMNCGEAAGQTVFHFHCHVIPRYHGDMEDPRGGVRHAVAGKGYYSPEESSVDCQENSPEN